jgi:hypothetical protein
MTNNDNVAGLCEGFDELLISLRSKTDSHPRGGHRLVNPDGPEAADTLERQAAENKRLRELLRCIRDTPANEFDAVDVANRIRAALTGEN